jgi:putative ABC transport system permease protein
MNAVSEKEYYALQTRSAAPIEYLGIFVSIIMAIGSSFAAMNTMYAAVARRAREIGTLRVLGFSRGSILFSFFLESVLLAGLGGVLGCLLVFPLNGVTTGIGSTTFSELAFSFRVTPQIMLAGILFASCWEPSAAVPGAHGRQQRNPGSAARGVMKQPPVPPATSH